jgi:DNA-binding transcriptional MerR regulator
MTSPEGMEQKKKLLKMRDLAQATGVSSGTIRYYIHKGILPRPYKTHKNMAYYDESFVTRIRLIKELQDKRYLPLDIIKMILEEKEFTFSGEEIQLFKEIEKPLFPDLFKYNGIGPLTFEELVLHTGLPPSDVQKLESIGLIQKDNQGRFDRECIHLVELVAELRKIGLTEERDFHIEHLQIHMDLIEFLTRKEIQLFTKRIAAKGLNSEEISRLIHESINTLNSMITILHKRHIRRITEEIS